MTATYEKIATTTLGSTAASTTFSSISGSYTDLVIIINANSTTASSIQMQFNGDTGSNYSRTVLGGTGSAIQSFRQTNTAFINLSNDSILTSSEKTNQIVHIQNYSNTTTHKTSLSKSNSATYGVDAVVGLWRNTSAITSVTLLVTGNTFTVGSIFTLYGIKAE
jgi:hypothetical protein